MWITERLAGWSRITKYAIVVENSRIGVTKKMANGLKLRNPSDSFDPSIAPGIEEFRFWLGYHLKLDRFLRANYNDFSAVEVLPLVKNVIENNEVNVINVTWKVYGNNHIDSNDFSGIFSNWKGIYLARKYQRLVTAVFPVNISSEILVASSMIFLHQSVLCSSNHKLLAELIDILHNKLIETNDLTLSNVANYQNALVLTLEL